MGEKGLYGPEIIEETTEKVRVIKEKLRTAQSRQKSYADRRRRPLEFQIGDQVFLKISPKKGKPLIRKEGETRTALRWAI